MASKLLKEVRDKGIVTIWMSAPQEGSGGALSLTELVGRCFGIYNGVAIPDGLNDQTTNGTVAEAAISYLSGLRSTGLGIRWGHTIDDMVKRTEQREMLVLIGTFVCPLIRNGSAGPKNYHPNEPARFIAEYNGAQPRFIYSPAHVLSEQKLKLTKELDSYHKIYHVWEKLDVALVNIGNSPPASDFALKAGYGDQFIRQKVAGCILNYFMNSQGHTIRSDMDCAIQIPLELLSGIRHVVGTCSANTSSKAFWGASKAGYLKHSIAPEYAVRGALE